MNRVNFIDLTKPRLVLMALLATACAFYMASDRSLNILLLFKTLLGAAMIGGGANALNQFIEKDHDAKMKRTENRPLPSGRMSQKKALTFGIAMSLAGIAHLFIFVNALAVLIGILILASYLFLYTPLKRVTPFNTFVGAIPGAMPSLLGWVAVKPHLNLEAFTIFAILFAWQLPHFLAIAWVYRDDYLKGGFRMFASGDEYGQSTGRLIVSYSVLLFALSVTPTVVGFAGFTYLFMAIFFGVNLCGFAFYLASHRLNYAKEFIYGSILYLFALNISMVIDKV